MNQDKSLQSRWKIGVQAAGWTLVGVVGRCLTSRYPQVPGSPYQWPTDEPYSLIASKELGQCETMLGKEHPSTLRCLSSFGCSGSFRCFGLIWAPRLIRAPRHRVRERYGNLGGRSVVAF